MGYRNTALHFFILLQVTASQSYASDPPAQLILSEDILLELPADQSPALQQIESAKLNNAFNEQSFNDQFNWSFNFQANQQETREQPIFEFQPIFSPVTNIAADIRKKVALGAEVKLESLVNRQRFSVLDNPNQTVIGVLRAQLNLDLWKDLFGSTTRKQVQNQGYQLQVAHYEGELARNSFKNSMRRLFWNLVALEEKTTITQELLGSAKQLYQLTKDKVRLSAADKADLASYTALIAQREGILTDIEYQKRQSYSQLQSLNRKLLDYELRIGKFDVDKTLNMIIECTGKIKTFPTSPLQFTYYDEILDLLALQFKNQAEIDKRYSDLDVKLIGSVQVQGLGDNFANARNDVLDNNRSGHFIGIQVSAPLGSSAKETERTKLKLEKARYEAQALKIKNDLDSFHKNIFYSVDHLMNVMKHQQTYKQALREKNKVLQQRFNQARITTEQLSVELDNLLNGELQLINTKLSIVNTLIDYFDYFPEFPCSFNKVHYAKSH